MLFPCLRKEVRDTAFYIVPNLLKHWPSIRPPNLLSIYLLAFDYRYFIIVLQALFFLLD